MSRIRWAALLIGASLVACGNEGAKDKPTQSSDAGSDASIVDDDDPSLDDAEGLPPSEPMCDAASADVPAEAAVAAYTSLKSGSFVADKAFYLGTVLAKLPEILAVIDASPALSEASATRDAAARSAPSTCGEDTACWSDRFLAPDKESLAAQLASTIVASGKLDSIVKSHLRASGSFALFAKGSDEELLRAAMLDLLTASADAFVHYAASMGPEKTATVLSEVVSKKAGTFRVWEPQLAGALALLAADGRDEAARYEPLVSGENAAAITRVGQVDFSRYAYSAIVVPGQGPTNLKTSLAKLGADRCDLAVARLKAKLAPFVLVSGGHVHPDRTPYSEAIEMKKYLMQEHGLAESEIFIDPHARHTTTNLRNATRILARAGIPMDKPVLVTSDIFQSVYISAPGGAMAPRCLDELGYLPWRQLRSITPNDSCMIPTATSLHLAGSDPLDP